MRHEASVLHSPLRKRPLVSPGMRWKDDNEMHPRRHIMRMELVEDLGQWQVFGLSVLNLQVLPDNEYILYTITDNEDYRVCKLLNSQELSNFKNHYKPQ